MAFLENYPANSRFAEAFRTLRTNIQFSFLDKEFRVILITSAGQAEGKTTTVMNLALSIIFGLMTGVGLAFLLEYMDRSLRTEEDVQRYMDLPVLSVVPEADKAKVGSQRSDVGRQTSEVGGRRSEVRGQRSEVRGRMSVVNPQTATTHEIKNQSTQKQIPSHFNGIPGELPRELPVCGGIPHPADQYPVFIP